MCGRCWRGGLDGRAGRRGREGRCLCVGSEWGDGRAGTWTGCYSNNLELGLAGLLMSGLFCNHLVSATAVLGDKNIFKIHIELVG